MLRNLWRLTGGLGGNLNFIADCVLAVRLQVLDCQHVLLSGNLSKILLSAADWLACGILGAFYFDRILKINFSLWLFGSLQSFGKRSAIEIL